MPIDLEKYWKHRKQYHRAESCFFIAQAAPRPEWPDLDVDKTCVLSDDWEGFRILATVRADEHLPIDIEYTNTYVEDAVKNPAWRPGSTRYKWVVLASGGVKEVTDGFNKYGYSKGVADHLARSSINEIVNRMNMPWYSQYVIEIGAFREGVELGFSVVGGFDLDDEYDARDAIWDNGLVQEAIFMAKSKLEKLCACEKAS